MPLKSPRVHALASIIVLLATLLVPTAASGQDGAQSESEPPVESIAQTSPVATPWVGSYEIWCTERNPSAHGGCTNHHTTPAIDIGMEVGTPIHAAGVGEVLQVELDCRASWCRGGAGLFVEIGHPDGTSSRYLHLDEVLVRDGDLVQTGQIIGTAGNTGSARSVHLHYDEHFPRGTRTPFGPLLSCIDGEVVQYPEVLGYSDWRDVPYGSIVTNEGFECLDGVELTSSPPVLFAGVGRFGVAAPLDAIGTGFEIQLSSDTGGGTLVSELPVTRQSIRRIAVTEGWTYSVRMRTQIGSVLTPWSDPIAYDPASIGDVATCLGFVATSEIGTDGPDVLIGTEGADEIAGGDGDDMICGMAGNDAIDGGAGNDFIDGDIGHDTISGGEGNDRLWGRRGSDILDGGSGRDRVSGGAGHDDASGGTGPDVILGGVGHDIVRGSGGNDRLVGGNGNDAVFGGAGRDRLFGGAGTNPLDGGAGIDLCVEPGDSPVIKCEA